jgi:phosphatidylserine/phosphatidylglycerophosphate/cardiolipin synthase-like enzyme
MTPLLVERIKSVETVFSQDKSIAGAIKRLVSEARATIDAALYSFNSEELLRCLLEAQNRKIHVRLLTDWSKYEQSELTRKLLVDAGFPHKLSRGRNGPTSKMHHKFLILDHSVVLTGSYNWTLASETQNFENIVVIREPDTVDSYRDEFNTLWSTARTLPRKGAREGISIARRPVS